MPESDTATVEKMPTSEVLPDTAPSELEVLTEEPAELVEEVLPEASETEEPSETEEAE